MKISPKEKESEVSKYGKYSPHVTEDLGYFLT